MDNYDRAFIVSVFLVTLYWVVALIYPDIASPFAAMYQGITDFAIQIGYPGAFIGSFIGNATIVFPFPYVIIPFVLGGLLDPTLVGVVSGIGALAGEMTGYIVGYGGGQLIDEEHTNGFRIYAEEHPWAIPLIIWLLAVTPLPDDFMIVPLGAAKYPWWKIVIPSLTGKIMMLVGIAWAGFFGMEVVEKIFSGGGPTSLISRTTEVVAILLILVVIYAMVKIDWTGLMSREKNEP